MFKTLHICRVLVVLAVVWAATSTTSAAPNPYKLKPGATGKICLDCHVTFEDTLKLRSVHTPLSDGDCAGCHNPHASDHGAMLAADATEVCFECHAGLVPDSPRSAHPAVTAGECDTCHDPHASDHAANLVMEGAELCATCHDDIAAAAAAATFKHSPVGSGCVTCHDPHASAESDALLLEDDPALCVACHDTARASFTQQHMGYSVAQARCTSCHDPHGSSSRGMLWETVHAPVANKMCKQCHNDAGASAPLALRASGEDLCRGCHNKLLNEIDARSQLHAPLADAVSCAHCHSPHASRNAGLLRANPISVCGDCHQDTIAQHQRSMTQHPPIAEGDCAACHDPHASDQEFLLVVDNSIELCAACHDWESHSSHPIGEDLIDPRNGNLTLDCQSCHLSHGSPFKYFAPFDPASDLCVNCHEKFGR